MSRPGNRKNMGKLLAPSVSITPQEVDAASDVEGSGVDRTGYFSAMVVCSTGAASGTPTGQTHHFKIEHSADDVTYADLAAADNGPNSDATTVEVTADDSIGKINLNLEVAEQYVRVTYLAASSSFDGQSSPANDVCAYIVLCEKDEGLES